MAATVQGIEWVKNESGKPAQIIPYPEGTGETFKKGALVIFDRSEDGVVEVTLAAGVPSDQNFLGIALKDASGTQGTEIPVLIPTANDVFSAELSNNSQTVFTAPAGDDRGQNYGLIKMSVSLKFVVDKNASTWVKVLDVDPRDVAKEQADPLSALTAMKVNQRLTFKFLESVLDNPGSQA